MSDLTRAIEIAASAHRNQVDKSGEDYILHPLRMMLSIRTKDARIVAVLHDVVEDSNITLEEIRKYGFSDEIMDALAAITKGRHEKYSEYLNRVSSNRLATIVKLQDLEDNLLRLHNLTEDDRVRLEKKYSSAMEYLGCQGALKRATERLVASSLETGTP